MNIILCAFVFILFYLPFTYQAESIHEIVDVMPDFITPAAVQESLLAVMM